MVGSTPARTARNAGARGRREMQAQEAGAKCRREIQSRNAVAKCRREEAGAKRRRQKQLRQKSASVAGCWRRPPRVGGVEHAARQVARGDLAVRAARRRVGRARGAGRRRRPVADLGGAHKGPVEPAGNEAAADLPVRERGLAEEGGEGRGLVVAHRLGELQAAQPADGDDAAGAVLVHGCDDIFGGDDALVGVQPPEGGDDCVDPLHR